MALAQSYITVSRRPPDVEDYIDMLRRYRSWIIGPMFLGLVCSTVIAFLWPDTFVSKALMRIAPQQVSERLVPAEFSTQITQQLNEMEQDILSRTSLEGIIRDPALELYKRQQTQRPMDEIVSDMRRDIQILPIQTPSSVGMDNRQMATAFSISFTYTDRYKAQAVVRLLVAKFTNQNVEVLRQKAHLTADFLQDEVNQAHQKLNNLDEEITKFKLANNGKLPEEFTSNTTMLNNLLLQQSQLGQSLQNAIDRKSLLESTLQGQISQLDYYKANAEDIVTPEQTARAQVQNQALAAATTQLQTLNEQLAGMQQILGAKAPEIKGLKARIASAQQTKETLEKEQQQKEAAADASGTPAATKVPNRNVQSALVGQQAQIDQTKSLINGATGNIKMLQTDQQNIARRIAMYEQRIEAAPLNERQWAALERDHALAQQEYDEKVKKRQSAATEQNLEEHQEGQKLELLDPASDPQQPTEPKRLQWAAIGTGLGLLVGVILAGAKEMKNTSLKNLKDVRAYTNLPVLSSIPLLENALLVRRTRRLFWLAWSAAFMVGTLAMLASAYYYLAGQR